jgi:hypothetical protein
MTTKESMMKNQVFVSTLMNKLAIIPIFFLTMCGTAPVVDPPAHACSPRLDGKPTYCPEPDAVCLSLDCPKPKPLLPKEELKGEIDIYEPMHWHQMQMMFQRNARRTRMEQNATKPSDAINNALDNFWEVQNGSDGSTEQEKLL